MRASLPPGFALACLFAGFFCVERRKSWRLLQSKAGIENLEYKAQRLLLGRVDSGEVPLEDFRSRSADMLEQCMVELKPLDTVQADGALLCRAA